MPTVRLPTLKHSCASVGLQKPIGRGLCVVVSHLDICRLAMMAALRHDDDEHYITFPQIQSHAINLVFQSSMYYVLYYLLLLTMTSSS